MYPKGQKNGTLLFTTRDNTPLGFRTLDPSDREEIRLGFGKLSQRSVYHRFFGFQKELTDKQLDQLVNIDQYNKVAWKVFTVADERGVGVGRFNRLKENSTEAEIALTVIDEYQNKGIGTVLLAILYYLAGKLGVKTFTGIMLASNLPLILRFQDLGAMMCRTTNEYEMRLPVHTDFTRIPDSRYTRVLLPLLNYLKANPLSYMPEKTG